jgi:hypothetical protein
MHVAGVQPAGSRGYTAVQAVVVEAKPAPARTDAPPAAARPSATPTLIPEPVVFPRERPPVDGRPLDVRQRRAAARYREHAAPEGRPRRSGGRTR